MTKVEEQFMAEQAEHAWDDMQLAIMDALSTVMQTYAMKAWRATENAPNNVPLICWVEEGLAIMTKNDMGDWRTSLGTPHHPPKLWMPCPPVPK